MGDSDVEYRWDHFDGAFKLLKYRNGTLEQECPIEVDYIHRDKASLEIVVLIKSKTPTFIITPLELHGSIIETTKSTRGYHRVKKIRVDFNQLYYEIEPDKVIKIRAGDDVQTVVSPVKIALLPMGLIFLIMLANFIGLTAPVWGWAIFVVVYISVFFGFVNVTEEKPLCRDSDHDDDE